MYNYDYCETGKRIKEKREEHGMSMEQLGKIIGVNRSTIKRYEDGETKNIKLAVLEKIASVLSTTIEYLYDGTLPKSGNRDSEKNTDFEGGPRIITNLSKIPILGIIRAGSPIIANEEILGFTYIDKNDPENYFALRVSGDSMNAARITDGDIVICRKQDYVEDGQIAVVLINNEDATVKRVYHQDNLIKLEPQSTNSIHHTIIVDLKKENFKILGRVVKVEFNVGD